MATYHVVTYGCQMNKNDSERIAAIMQDAGFVVCDEETADVIILNTCSVRKSAEDRVYGLVKKLSERRDAEKSGQLICVTGCMAGRDRNHKLQEKMPGADLFFPISEITLLPQRISQLRADLVSNAEVIGDYLAVTPERKNVKSAFVTIQTGCNKFCTYCVVPFARGFERNRSVKEILDEVHDLVAHGCVEITLLGQTVNSYRASDSENFSKENPYRDHFAALLWELNQISGIARIHFTAPHPLSLTAEGIEALSLPKHVKFLHLPVQAGNDEVLRRMNRRYSRQLYIDLVKQIYARNPDIALGTDIIVGFPGETREQFEETVSLYRECQFDISYTAMYSPRSGTVAFKGFPDDVSREEKKERFEILQKLMKEMVLEKNQRFLGRTVSVLVDTFIAKEDGMGWCEGNSEHMKRVRCVGTSELVGSLVSVKISKAQEWMLYGTVAK